MAMPRVNSARDTPDDPMGPAPMRARLVSVLLRPTAPPLALGLAVAASLITAETLLVYLFKQVAPHEVFGVVYLIGVLVVSTGWGFGLAATTSVASALAFNYFRIQPGQSIIPTEAEDAVAIVIFLAVALLANTLAYLVRSRAAEADQRRQESELAAERARVAAGQARMLAEEQAALRRVATLVARGVTPGEVFSSVAMELARFMGVYTSALLRYQVDGTSILVAGRDEAGLIKMPVGERFSLEGDNLGAMVLRTRRAARIDYEHAAGSTAARIRDLGIRSGVGAPIVVEARLWGVAMVGWSRSEPLPPDTEARVANFADLVATAIANAETRAELTASRARIVAAADDARRHFERDLHDGAQQRLVSLGLKLRTAEALVPPDLHQLNEQISDVVMGLAGVSEESARDLTGHSSGDPVEGRAVPGTQGAGPPLRGPGRNSTSLSRGGCRRLPKWPRTTLWQKHSPTWPSTRKRLK